MSIFIELILAFVVAAIISNITEWFMHRFVLHGTHRFLGTRIPLLSSLFSGGKNKDSYFHYHWVHHNTCRRSGNTDPIYKNIWTTKDVLKEMSSLVIVGVFSLPTFFTWPALYAFLMFFTFLYFVMHAISHTRVRWSKKWMPWHRDHHMGRNQDSNWCVTFPWFDWVMGTRIQYTKTKK